MIPGWNCGCRRCVRGRVHALFRWALWLVGLRKTIGEAIPVNDPAPWWNVWARKKREPLVLRRGIWRFQ